MSKMAAVIGGGKVCETNGCTSEARLQCPTCIKLEIPGSFFCSQVSYLKHSVLYIYGQVGSVMRLSQRTIDRYGFVPGPANCEEPILFVYKLG